MAFYNNQGPTQGFSLFPEYNQRPTVLQGGYPPQGFGTAPQQGYPALAQLLRKQVQPTPQPGQQQVLDVSPMQTPSRRQPMQPLGPQAVERAVTPPMEAQSAMAAGGMPGSSRGMPMEAQSAMAAGGMPGSSRGMPMEAQSAEAIEGRPTGKEDSDKPTIRQVWEAQAKSLYDNVARYNKIKADPLYTDLLNRPEISWMRDAEYDYTMFKDDYKLASDEWAKNEPAFKEIDDILRNTNAQYEIIKDGYSGKTPISDVGIATAYLKAIDPDSVARESEVQSVYRAGAPSEVFIQKIRNIRNGEGKMPPRLRDDIMQRIEEMKNARIRAADSYISNEKESFIQTHGNHGRYRIARVFKDRKYKPTAFTPGVKLNRINELKKKGTFTPEQEAARQKERQKLEAELPPGFQAGRETKTDYDPDAIDIGVDMGEILADSLTLGGYGNLKASWDSFKTGVSFDDALAIHKNQLGVTSSEYPLTSTAAYGLGKLALGLLMLRTGGKVPWGKGLKTVAGKGLTRKAASFYDKLGPVAKKFFSSGIGQSATTGAAAAIGTTLGVGLLGD